ncbi:MAG: alpha/beta fold hydrolase [Actinomycetota bacterium]
MTEPRPGEARSVDDPTSSVLALRTTPTAAGPIRHVDAGDDAAIVLLHGEDASPDYWRDYVPTFAQAFRVLAPELPDDIGAAERFERVSALLDALGSDRVALVGHGVGGATALELAARLPRVGALVLVDAILTGTEQADVASLGAREDVHALLVWGEDDDRSPVADAERLADALPMSALATIPGAGHDMPLEEPATLVPLLFEWLRFRYLGRSHRHEQEGPVLVTLGRRPTMTEEGIDDLIDDAQGSVEEDGG